MDNTVGMLLVLVIFFGVMSISYWLIQIGKVLEDIEDKL